MRFPDPYFSISVERQGPRAVVVVAGELDIATAPKLARTLAELGATHREIVIDLRDVSFMDVIAIRRVLRAQGRLEGRLALAAVPDAVMRMLRLTGLADDFLVLPDPSAVF